MASFLTSTLSSLCSLALFSTFFNTVCNGTFSEQFLATERIQKISHLHFYFHDTWTGKNPTVLRIITPPNTSVGGFGSMVMMDDPLTEGQEVSSKLVGRAQGLYGMASQHDSALLLVMNLAFVEGKYNGSSLSILGRNPFLETVREMPILGGTGLFRFARGYALAKTCWSNPATGDAIVEYNVSVWHY